MAGGWSSQARQFDVTGWAGRTNCEARFMAKPRAVSENPALTVWNPEGWVPLATGGGSWLPADRYAQVVSRRFDMSGARWVYVEAMIGNGHHLRGVAVRFDEFELECF